MLGFLIVIVLITLPWGLQKLLNRFKWMDVLGSAFWCYILGLSLSSLFQFSEKSSEYIAHLMKLSIPLALPLFVFAKSSHKTETRPKDLIRSFFLLIFSVVSVATLIGLIYQSIQSKSLYYAAMMAATYVGGTINMASLHQIFNLAENDFLIVNTSDTITGGIYLLLLLSIMPKIYGLVLKREKNVKPQNLFLEKIQFCKKDVAKLFGLSLLTVVLSFLPTKLFPVFWESMIFFSTLTLVSWVFSRKIPKQLSQQSTAIGNYLLMIFCLCIGTQLKIETVINLPWNVFSLVLFILLAAIFLHLFLAKIFKIERDIFLISHTAGIFGPVFIAPMTNAIQRSDLLISGIGIAVLGNILGNYVGLLVYHLIQLLGS
jgi:uncharacterized membrane protein